MTDAEILKEFKKIYEMLGAIVKEIGRGKR